MWSRGHVLLRAMVLHVLLVNNVMAVRASPGAVTTLIVCLHRIVLRI